MFHKAMGISGIVARILASQEGLCSVGLAWNHDLTIPGTACLLHNTPQLGRKNVALLSDHFNTQHGKVQLQNFSVQSTY
jgi:hypothetical protein